MPKTNKTKTKINQISPAEFLKLVNEKNVRIERIVLDSGILTLTKDFQAGNLREYSDAESDCSILYYVKNSGGSIWGTSGDGIGGYSAVQNGKMRLNKSGIGKKWLKELQELLNSD